MTEITVVRAVQTCESHPAQWNAWTDTGQYLYLRYRGGHGTVDAYVDDDTSRWVAPPDGAVARFEHGDRWASEIELPEFCERAGLRLELSNG